MFTSLFRLLKSASPRSRAGRGRPTARPRRATCSPQVEVLEDRTLLSAGALDPSFGTGGKVTTAFPGSYLTLASDVVVQPDGKVVTAGATYSPTGNGGDFALARYLSDGRLDPSFGAGGMVVTDFGGDEFFPKAALQSDGKILVAGTTYDPANDYAGNFALARYLSDGRLDPNFGNGGKVITDFGGDDSVGGVALQTNGRIVVAGATFSAAPGSLSDVALAAYLPNGRLDPSFGAGGEVTTSLGGYDSGAAVVIRPDGKIVVGAQHFDLSTSTGDFALVQYNVSGGLDTGFGVGGYVVNHFGPGDSDSGLTGIALQSDGKVVAVGGEENFSTFTSDFLVARYNKDGTLDAGFGAGGHVTTGFGGFDLATSVVLQPDGKIVAAGPYQGDTSGFALVRYNRDGSPDADFGTAGQVTTAFGDFALNFGVALEPDGKIVSAGTAFDPTTGVLTIAVARYEGHDAPSSLHPAAPVVAHGGAAAAPPVSAARGVSAAALGLGIDWEAVDAFFSALPSRKRRGGVG